MWARALFGLRHAHFEHAPIDFWRKHPECPTNEHGVSAFPSIQYAGISALGSVLVGEELPSNALEALGGGHLRSQIGGSVSSEGMGQILQTIESEVRSRPSAMEYEMAYQARIAIDRIRFAIKQTEQIVRHSDQAREASLVDALDRLEAADRHFQNRFHGGCSLGMSGKTIDGHNGSSR